jgi:hypothetical protein
MSWLIAAGTWSLALGQNAPGTAPLPSDPLEMVTGQTWPVGPPANRQAVVQLLGRARDNYALRGAGKGYDLKVTFRVNSGGLTQYDGVWKMEDVFDPKLGHRWTASSSSGYSVTRISANGMLYGDDPASYVPLRLQEARAALLDAIPSPAKIGRATIRASTADFHNTQLTCVLLSGSAKDAAGTTGRRWDEGQECIDPQTGLLMVHSQAPGRYYAYDYSNAPQLAGHTLPRTVTVTEAGKVVTEISVKSLTELPSADPSLFVPTEEMKAKGRAVAMTGAQKIVRAGRGASAPGGAADAVCVFGLVTPSGELVEAHSLQPSDPNSEAALADAKTMNFSGASPIGAKPQQHFVFIIEKFGAAQ